MRLMVLGLVCALIALATACGGGSRPAILEDKPASAATPAPSENPRATPTPIPTPAGPPGRIMTSVTAICRLGETDAIVYVTYRAQAFGNTVLHHVRLMVNNKLADDSGEIFDMSFDKETAVHVSPGKQYTLTVVVTAPNALAPQFANVVRCPRNAGPGV